jgi:hypothetical protein
VKGCHNQIPVKAELIATIKKHPVISILAPIVVGILAFLANWKTVFPSHPEPKIEVVPHIYEVSAITFAKPNEVTVFEGDYNQLIRELIWCTIVEAPMFSYYIENGYLSSEDLSKMRAKREQINKEFAETLANVPISVNMKNNGTGATTIVSIDISIPLTGQMGPINSNLQNVRIYIEPSKVADVEYFMPIPVVALMYGAVIDWTKEFIPPDTPDSLRDKLLNAMKPYLDAAPFITFESKGTVVVTDQFGTQYRGTFDLRPLVKLLEKAKPPESSQAASKETTRGKPPEKPKSQKAH